jgi:hypothetical protein
MIDEVTALRLTTLHLPKYIKRYSHCHTDSQNEFLGEQRFQRNL